MPETGTIDEEFKFTSKFELATLACIIVKPEQFHWQNIGAGCFGSLPMLEIYISFTNFMRKYGRAPTWIALEEWTVKERKRHNAEDDDIENIMECFAELKAIDVDKELAGVQDRLDEWYKGKMLQRALDQFAGSLDEMTKEKDKIEAKENLLCALTSLSGDEVQTDDGKALLDALLEPPLPVIGNLLDKGEVAMFASGSKSFKTWMTLHLTVCKVMGTEWFGFKLKPGKVTYLNFELPRYYFRNRLDALCRQMSVVLPEGKLKVLHLRGSSASAEDLIAKLTVDTKTGADDLIIFDPLYTMYGDKKVENAAEDMIRVMQMFGVLAKKSEAAVWINHHFSKGNQAEKDAIDRLAGSGAFGRYSDLIMTMTRLKTDNCYRMDFKPRNHEEPKPFGVRWEYPLLVRDDTLDVNDLKRPGGREQEFTKEQLLDALAGEALKTQEWKKKVCKDTGMSESTFDKHRAELRKLGWVVYDRQSGLWRLKKQENDL
jgi:hypothetical protein